MRKLEVVPLGERSTLDGAFMRSLRACYRVHGVDGVAKSLPSSQRREVQLVVARDDDGELVGGARVHSRRGDAGFPAEGPLAAFPRLLSRFVALAGQESVELSALWTAPVAKRTGIARLLAQASIAWSIALGKRVALTFSHQHFEHVLFPIGMRPIRGADPVGFPTPAYRSRVYVAELPALRAATSMDRELIRDLAASFSRGQGSLMLERFTDVEHGAPSFGIQVDRAPMRAVS
jgi:hypothetical protein